MDVQRLLKFQNPAGFQPEWGYEDVQLTFFKCTKWQVEQTLDPFSCPYHYFCDTNYPGSYPAYVDALFLLVVAAAYLVTFVVMVMELAASTSRTANNNNEICRSKRYVLPSGPVFLPLILLAFAKGYRIHNVVPVSSIGPAVFLLLQVSSLTFDTGIDRDARYAFFEASTVSGILHASLYLDSVVMPYYTGFDALVSSAFSGECHSCICRNEPLVVGGRLVGYRAWSLTTFLVAGALCCRIACRVQGKSAKSRSVAVKRLVERLSWVMIVKDCVYLAVRSPPEISNLPSLGMGAVILLAVVCYRAYVNEDYAVD
ncbi:hypothetical protein LINGRAHAP2_LOCUS16040 [Linum grandiflorum]